MAFRTNKTPVLQTKSASGSVATFNTALAMPLSSCNIALTATQSGSGTPSPDNVRTINGYSAINISATGKNLFSSAIVQGALYRNGNETNTTTIRVKTYDYIPCKPNTQYVVSFNSGIIPVSVVYYDINKAYLSGDTLSASNTIFTTPTSAVYVRFGIANINLQHDITPSDVTQSQLELGDIVTIYDAYNGIYTTITIGSTVYGGEYDARTGLLTVAHGYIASYNGEVINEPWISSMDKYVEGGTPTSGAQVVYPLSTPQTIQLPPCPIYTLEGVNNIWSDTGDIDLTYQDLDIAKRGNFREVFKLPS